MNDNASLRRAIVVCALGYFIDVFDIQLFAVLRVPSLIELGVSNDKLSTVGGYILNAQMVGMVLGAFLWGFLGDRFGRLKALYGSILIYSCGTLACSFVHDPLVYGIMRFAAGFGLAGETGAAITLIAEMMPPLKRTWGIILVAGVGFLGPTVAVLISWFAPWRETYLIAGVLGFAILALRIRFGESDLFKNAARKNIIRGSWKLLLQKRQILTAAQCVAIGLPLVYGWLLLNFFSAEISSVVLSPNESFDQKTCLITFYLGAACGDVLSGFVSQFCRSRRKAIAIFFMLGSAAGLGMLLPGARLGLSTQLFYALYFVIGMSAGGWVLMATICAEQFGTNIRATAAIVLTNFVRGSSIPIIIVFQSLRQIMSITDAAALIGSIVYVLGFWSLRHLRETHTLDLDYIETLEAVEP